VGRSREQHAVSADFGFDTTCNGPFHARIEADGTLQAKGACGIDLVTMMATLELGLAGSVAADGTVAGTADISVVAVPGSNTASWTGEGVGDTLTVHLDTTASIAGGSVALAGTMMATAQ